MTIGDLLRQKRKAKGLTQRVIPGFSFQKISDYECGRLAPGPKQLLMLSKFYDIKLSELFKAYELEGYGKTRKK